MVNDNIMPPNLQNDLPNYPEVSQFVRVTSATIGSNVYPAVTQQYTGSLSFRDRESCYLYEPNGVALTANIYDCRLIGSYLTLPLYATTCCVSGVAPGSSSAVPCTVILVDNVSNSGYQTASSYSWQHFNNGNYVVVGLALLENADLMTTTVTYGGQAMTLLRDQDTAVGTKRVELYGLTNPPLGVSTVSVATGVSAGTVSGAVSLWCVDQSSSTEAANSDTGTGATATVVVTTVADADLVIDIIAVNDASITVGSGQVQRWNIGGSAGSGAMSTEGPKSPAGAVTMTWNLDALSSWTQAAIGLKKQT